MSERKLQVFVSSTFDDMKDERQAAVQAVLEAGHIPAGMELFSAGNKEQLKIIEGWIDQCDVYMLVLGGRYGTLEPESNLSYIECEYRYAVSTGKPAFTLLMNDDFLEIKVKDHGTSAIECKHTEKFGAFKDIVLSKICAFYGSTSELQKETIKSLNTIQADYEIGGWVRASRNLNVSIGNVEIYYHPIFDPMKYKLGKAVKSKKGENNWNPYTLTAKFSNQEPVRWIYGPYRTLPVTGEYRVIFRIRLNSDINIEPERKIVELDVYDFYGGKVTYAKRVLKFEELDHRYKKFHLKFNYQDLSSRLEYRVGFHGIEGQEISISVDEILIERES